MKIDKSGMLGSAHPTDIAAYLSLIGDDEAAERFRGGGARSQAIGVPFIKDQWGHTGAKLGYIEESKGNGKSSILNAIGMEPDKKLVGRKLKITLDHFYVMNYPGMGQHTILCDFTGKNQAGEESEAMRFALTVTANDKSAAAAKGMPIFVGVNVGADGLSFEGKTINVRSSDDDLVLGALDNATFKDGLALLTTAQPVLKPFVKLAEGIVGAVAKRNMNREVFRFGLGLDFSKNATSAKLRKGSYVVVQTDEPKWDWTNYEWDAAAGAVLPKGKGAPLEFNHMVFGVSEYAG